MCGQVMIDSSGKGVLFGRAGKKEYRQATENYGYSFN
jgi:hypothetical protein